MRPKSVVDESFAKATHQTAAAWSIGEEQINVTNTASVHNWPDVDDAGRSRIVTPLWQSGRNRPRRDSGERKYQGADYQVGDFWSILDRNTHKEGEGNSHFFG